MDKKISRSDLFSLLGRPTAVSRAVDVPEVLVEDRNDEEERLEEHLLKESANNEVATEAQLDAINEINSMPDTDKPGDAPSRALPPAPAVVLTSVPTPVLPPVPTAPYPLPGSSRPALHLSRPVAADRVIRPVKSRRGPYPQEARAPETTSTSALDLLYTSVPNLWKYTLKKYDGLLVKEQRAKLRELLVWILDKEGFSAEANAQTRYRKGRDNVDGRIDLLISVKKDGRHLLAIEADWAKSSASILKLLHWKERGLPALWVIGADCPPGQAYVWREFADDVAGGSTRPWLRILHVEHGWAEQ